MLHTTMKSPTLVKVEETEDWLNVDETSEDEQKNESLNQKIQEKVIEKSTGGQRLMQEFFKPLRTISNLPQLNKDAFTQCMAYCRKCEVNKIAERQTVNCQICTCPLEYHCIKCNHQFFSFASLKSHVTEGLVQISSSVKCSKCCRSYFSTRCSLWKHERTCKSIFRFNKEVSINLERYDFQSDVVQGINSLNLPSFGAENVDLNLDIVKSGNIDSDEFEVEEDFKVFKFETTQRTVTPTRRRKQSNANFIFTYCTKCHESIKYSFKKGTLCQKCNSVLSYQCGKCLKLFEKISNLRSHISGVHKEPKFICEHCNYKCHKMRVLNQHIQSRHLPRDPNANKCKCGRSFSSKNNLNKHLKICGLPPNQKRWDDNRKELFCDHCEYTARHKSNIRSHIVINHLPRDYTLHKCKKCKKGYADKAGLVQHSKVCGQTKDFVLTLMKFFCHDCPYKSMLKGNLTRHIKQNHLPPNPSLFKCIKCNKSYSTHSKLKQHFKICGQTKDFIRSLLNYSCDQCEYKTSSKFSLSNHIESKHLPRRYDLYKCTSCHKNFSTHSCLKAHERRGCGKLKDSAKTFHCNDCDYKICRKVELTHHIQNNHLPRELRTHKCSKCGKKLSSASSLHAHFKICGLTEDNKYLLRRFSCDHCDYKTDMKVNLAGHIHTKHFRQDLKIIKCPKCQKKFSKQSELASHSRKCGKPQNYCKHCSFKSQYKQVLANHVQSKHLPRDPNANKCDKCGSSFTRKTYLKVHSRICGVPQSKIFSCSHCNYKDGKKSGLAHHIELKHSLQDLKCTKCSKTFHSKKSLRRHLGICGLPPHLRTSSKIPPSICDYCNYECANKSNLIYHIQSKHMSGPFPCSKCGKLFDKKYELYCHTKHSCEKK